MEAIMGLRLFVPVMIDLVSGVDRGGGGMWGRWRQRPKRGQEEASRE
jgi:hypothetical protein